MLSFLRSDLFLPSRTEGISTSDLIARVLKNNEAFVKRNLKKGFTEADLGVGTQLN